MSQYEEDNDVKEERKMATDSSCGMRNRKTLNLCLVQLCGHVLPTKFSFALSTHTDSEVRIINLLKVFRKNLIGSSVQDKYAVNRLCLALKENQW
jgi:hypothetical protein